MRAQVEIIYRPPGVMGDTVITIWIIYVFRVLFFLLIVQVNILFCRNIPGPFNRVIIRSTAGKQCKYRNDQ
jgi:hypothetical protein